MMSDVDEYTPICPKEDSQEDDLKKPRLQRTIGVLSACGILFGNCVGAGIFISPKGVYERAGSAGAGLVVWALGGVIATSCALAYAELGTMIPESGGEFIYIRRTYGKFLSFIFSFCNAFLIKPAACAPVAITFAEYFGALFWGHEIGPIYTKLIAATLIALLAVLNIVGVKLVIKICSLASLLKMGVVGFLLTCGIAILARGQGEVSNFDIQSSFAGSSSNPADYGLAFYFCLYSLQSWNSLNYMTEELKNPSVTLPLGGLLGMSAVSISYMLANIAYLMMFTVRQIVLTNTIAMDSGFLAFGKAGEIIMSVGLMVSCVGCLAGAILCIPRNIQKAAEQGVFPGWMSTVSPTFHTPIPAVILFSATMCSFLLFDASTLIACGATVEWLFYCVTFSILLYLRYKQPHQHRPFKVPLFMAIALFFITGTFVLLPLFSPDSRLTVLAGLAWLPLSAAVYGIRFLVNKYILNSAEALKKSRSQESCYSGDSGYNAISSGTERPRLFSD